MRVAIFKGKKTVGSTFPLPERPRPWGRCPVCGAYTYTDVPCESATHATAVIRKRRKDEGWVELSGSELTTVLLGGGQRTPKFDFQDFSDHSEYKGPPFESEGGMMFFRPEDLPPPPKRFY